MGESQPTIPQPTPYDDADESDIPEHLKPSPSSPVQVIQLNREGRTQIAIVFKRTYRFRHGRTPWPAEEQEPLDREGSTHEPLTEEQAPSYASLPELVGFKTGTDLVVQGDARPRRPTSRMEVCVRVGEREQKALVFGRRFADYVNGNLVFTSPEPFESMPLRYENAYGGRDRRFEAHLAEEVERSTPAEDLRRARPSFEAVFDDNHPLAYPRNRFGKGYVLEDRRDLIEGRELPNLERPSDLLTPERLVVGHPLDWGKQPIPIGFDYLEPSAFPRTALLGIPQATRIPMSEMPEVERGVLPADYSRGTIFEGDPEEIPDRLHPHGSRCASIGLWLPHLLGDETVGIQGMDESRPRLRCSLPGERPRFTGSWPGGSGREILGDLLLVAISVDDRKMSLVWSARDSLDRPLRPGEAEEVQEELDVRMREV